MDSSLGVLLVLITSVAIHIVQAQDQNGFISLDCGLPANELSPYNQAYTGLSFSSDENFIQSGKIGRIQANRESEFGRPYRTLRYFPNGTRNCYNLSVAKGRNHLIRAFFLYANYDGFDINPNFDLYLGSNLWDTIDLQGQVNGLSTELLHIPISNSLQICLVKTGTTIPFISSLEIRPMGDDSYITDSGSLKLLFRNCLRESKNFIRMRDSQCMFAAIHIENSSLSDMKVVQWPECMFVSGEEHAVDKRVNNDREESKVPELELVW